ncbi:heavy metal-binding protein HIP-like [Mytilus edulis]|uniref:heavy metal-binding protein HIP-like n=1 Tax=Mytilus edulis TaxID=6550 RepID=UPI0039F05782
MKGFVYVLYLIFTGIIVGATRNELNIKYEEKEIMRKLDHLTAVVKQVYEENKQLRSTVNEVLDDNKQLKSTVHKIEFDYKRLQNGYRKIVDTNNELRAEIHNIKGCCSHEQQHDNSLTSFKRLLLNNGDADGQTVAFTAAVNRHLTLGPNQAVQFEKIITNVGNAYDPRHGHMIAPVKGLYLISATVFSAYADSEYLEIVQNGNNLVHFFEEAGAYSPMSQTIIVSLEKSDVVWVRNHDSATYSGHHLYGGPASLYNTFSGFLLKAL